MKGKGWYGERYRHILASKGVRTVTDFDKKLLKDIVSDNFDVKRDYTMSTDAFSDEEVIDFGIEGVRIQSSILVDNDNNKIRGVLRFPPSKDKYETIEEEIKDEEETKRMMYELHKRLKNKGISSTAYVSNESGYAHIEFWKSYDKTSHLYDMVEDVINTYKDVMGDFYE